MAKQMVKGHDLLFVYSKDISRVKPLAREKDIRGKKFTKNGIEYWIQEDAIRADFGNYGNLFYEDIVNIKGEEYKAKIDEGIAKGEYTLIPKANGKTVIGKVRRVDEDYSKFYTVIKHLNASGVNTLSSMGLAERFSYPKPVSLIKYLIKGATFFPTDHDPIILDFFAGSGTTGQAVLELNKEDGKNRHYILCTNNEVNSVQKLRFVQDLGYLKEYEPNPSTSDAAIERKIYDAVGEKENFERFINENEEVYQSYGICQSVTLPRVKKVIKGYMSEDSYKEILFEKKITASNYYKGKEFKEKIDSIIEDRKYQEYNVKVSDSTIVLTGSTTKHFQYDGIPANLKYFKCGWTPRKPEDYLLSNALCLHIKEMIELQNGIEVDNIRNVLILNKEDYQNYVMNDSIYNQIENIWVNQNIIFNSEEMERLNALGFKYIPKEFFGQELKEVAE